MTTPVVTEGTNFANMDKECSALGGLFQTVVNDMKGSYVVWEDFTAKALKLHQQLRLTSLAAAAFLDAFQKVADMATNTQGATREIGSALTRICMRQRNIETKLKQFTAAVVESLVIPMQDKMEDWKKVATQMDKEHSKEYKRNRHEIKKLSADTARLQKKAKKGKPETQKQLDRQLQILKEKYTAVNEVEKNAVRHIMVEERSRYCHFVNCLLPAVELEVELISEISHLEEIVRALKRHSADPRCLPEASEQAIQDLKNSDTTSFFQTPPGSPGSGGSRKSSMCSLNSMNSSSSTSSNKSHHSPSHHPRYRNISHQVPHGAGVRLSSASSQDSGFTSQDTLFHRPATPPPLDLTTKNLLKESGSTGTSSNGSTPSSPYPSTMSWPMWEETLEKNLSAMPERPHTISSPYERQSAARPALTAQTFQPPAMEMRKRTASTSTNSPPESPDTDTPSHPVMSRSHEMYSLASRENPAPTRPVEAKPQHKQGSEKVSTPRELPPRSRQLHQSSQSSNYRQTAATCYNKFAQQPVYMNVTELQATLAARRNWSDTCMFQQQKFINSNAGNEGTNFHQDVKNKLADSPGEPVHTEELSAIYNDIQNEFGKYCSFSHGDVSKLKRSSVSGYPVQGSPRRGCGAVNKTPPPVPTRKTSAVSTTVVRKPRVIHKASPGHLRSSSLPGESRNPCPASSEDECQSEDSQNSTPIKAECEEVAFAQRSLVHSLNANYTEVQDSNAAYQHIQQRRYSDLSERYSSRNGEENAYPRSRDNSKIRASTKQTDV